MLVSIVDKGFREMLFDITSKEAKDMIEREKEKRQKKAAECLQPPPLLKTLEDMLHNRIIQKKEVMYETHNRAITDRVWTEN